MFNLLQLPLLALDEVFKHMNVLELIELSLTSTKTGIMIYQILQKMKLQLDFHHDYEGKHISLLRGPRYSILQEPRYSILEVLYHINSAKKDVRTTHSDGPGMVKIAAYSGCFLYPIVRRRAETIKRRAETIKKVLSILFKFITSFHISGEIVNKNLKIIQELLLTSNRKFPISFESRDVTHFGNPLVDFSDMFLQMKSLKYVSLLGHNDIHDFLEAWVNKKSSLEEFSIKGRPWLECLIMGIRGVNMTPFERIVKGKVVEKCYEIKRKDGVKAIVYLDGDTFNLVNVNCL